MLREFTRDIGRYKTGEARDLPQPTWNQMAASAQMELDDFTKRLNPNPNQQMAMGGPVKLRKRLGTN